MSEADIRRCLTARRETRGLLCGIDRVHMCCGPCQAERLARVAGDGALWFEAPHREQGREAHERPLDHRADVRADLGHLHLGSAGSRGQGVQNDGKVGR